MKYFLDTKFLEGEQIKRFLWIPYGKTKPTIDLISIGIVAEDGREKYWISKDFNLKEAWNRHDVIPNTYPKIGRDSYLSKIEFRNYWIRENVLKPIWIELFIKDEPNMHPIPEQLMTYSSLKYLINKYGKTNVEIAEEVKDFCRDKVNVHYVMGNPIAGVDPVRGEPEFYAYYADIWVVFCWLFGRMIDLPKGFSMYCRDLKQMEDEIESADKEVGEYSGKLKSHVNYPKQENERNALVDARWNKKLFEFLEKL